VTSHCWLSFTCWETNRVNDNRSVHLLRDQTGERSNLGLERLGLWRHIVDYRSPAERPIGWTITAAFTCWENKRVNGLISFTCYQPGDPSTVFTFFEHLNMHCDAKLQFHMLILVTFFLITCIFFKDTKPEIPIHHLGILKWVYRGSTITDLSVKHVELGRIATQTVLCKWLCAR
jgi:hypothetical protein